MVIQAILKADWMSITEDILGIQKAGNPGLFIIWRSIIPGQKLRKESIFLRPLKVISF